MNQDHPARAPFAIRPATVGDWPQIAALLVELGRDVSPSAVHNPSFEIRFGGHLALRESRTLVAADAGRLVGLLDMEFRQRLGHPRPQAWVNDLVVTESMRGRGVGSALLAEAETLAIKRGCFRMSLETASWRERTHSFYMGAGWRDNGKWFVKLLDPSWGAAGYSE
jgi:GNAT superfamily N-acetyltransferase